MIIPILGNYRITRPLKMRWGSRTYRLCEDRDAEFPTRDVSQQELIQKTGATITMTDRVFSTLTKEQLNAEYSLLVLAEKASTAFFLIHLAKHLSYHLGQVNYHRRLLDN